MTKRQSNDPPPATISSTKFVLLSYVTFGLFHVYWSWYLWEIVRRSNGEAYRIKSSVRAIFLGLSNFLLFPQLSSLAKRRGYNDDDNVILLAVLYLFVTLIPFGFLITTLFLLPILRMQNRYILSTKSKFAPTKPNWWLIAALVLASLIGIGLAAVVP
jgi:hypothetical protein